MALSSSSLSSLSALLLVFLLSTLPTTLSNRLVENDADIRGLIKTQTETTEITTLSEPITTTEDILESTEDFWPTTSIFPSSVIPHLIFLASLNTGIIKFTFHE